MILKNLKVSINDSWEIPSVKHLLTITSINVQESDHVELLAKTIDKNLSWKTNEKKHWEFMSECELQTACS